MNPLGANREDGFATGGRLRIGEFGTKTEDTSLMNYYLSSPL